MTFSNLHLAQRLERAEGRACAGFAEVSRRLHPERKVEWIEMAGIIATFNGIDSPVTQSFGLGLFEELTADRLDAAERFFLDRQTAAVHEVSPFAGVPALDLLTRRHYQPIELANVLYRDLDRLIGKPADTLPPNLRVHPITPDEAPLWGRISAAGWAHNHAELLPFLTDFGALLSVPDPGRVCFLAAIDGQPGAAAVLNLHQGVALFGGAATIPDLRRRGLQNALLAARLDYAVTHGCDLAMMVAEPGSDSHRNAERHSFRVAYTRTKWRLQR